MGINVILITWRSSLFSFQKPFVCTHPDGCVKTFSTISHLERHIATHDKVSDTPKVLKVYKCSYCDITYRHKFNLRIHEAVHTGNKPYKCDQCEAAFILKGRLKKHSKTHSGYPCAECEFKGETWSALRKHKKSHRKKCPRCHKQFASEIFLQKHLSTHDQNHVFQCSQCSLSYKSSRNLNAHTRAVHDKVKFSCDVCHKQFSFKKSLVQHKAKKHCPGVLTDSTNGKRTIKRRKLMAIALSAHENAPAEASEELLLKDKIFRKENPALLEKLDCV